MNVAIIPARGGSKRIPRKNIRPFVGKPIIAYSILAALESGLFERVIVSTDDEEIAAVAREWGAQTPFTRPGELADDYAGTNEVVAHALQWLEMHGEPVENACCIYATAPFVTADRLRFGYELLISSGKQFVFTATSFPFPILRAVRLLPDNGVEPMFPESIDSRSQDLEEAYHDAGQYYWGKAEAFITNISLFARHSAPALIPRYLVQDIDTLEDWRRAEVLYCAWRMVEDR